MKKLPWLKMRKKTDPELPLKPPIWFGNQSNGEYFRPATEKDRKLERLVLERSDENARRLGMYRRDFLASAMGMATTLLAMKQVGCSSTGTGEGADGGAGGSGSDGGGGSGGSSGGDGIYVAGVAGVQDLARISLV